MTLSPEIRSFYTQAGAMTDLAAHPDAFKAVPSELFRNGQHDPGLPAPRALAPAYEQKLTPERRAESHLRSTDQMLTTTFVQRPEAGDHRPPGDGSGLSAFAGTSPYWASRCCEPRAFLPGRAAVSAPQTRHLRRSLGGRGLGRRALEAVRHAAGRVAARGAQARLRPGDVPRDRFIIAGDAWQQCRSEGTT